MTNLKLVKKSMIYFLPVILTHIIFTLIDKSIQYNGNDVDLRLSVVHLSIYFYFFVIPIYLMIVNIVYNAKKEIKYYYDDLKFGAIGILGANISVLIINIISFCLIKSYDVNFFVEFFIILVPEIIMFAMISFLGSFIVKKKDDDADEEETLEGLKIPKRDVEFYRKNEMYDRQESKENEMEDENDKNQIDEESKKEDEEAEETADKKENMNNQNENS